ncbi:biological adhesion [Desmophyllum pertusum]|uniref:Biological adhesion n=1 Tax=Desmophyllum pertusum TaxID=174260 RepID=A0A9X0CUC0_9CNID|nr:biological adhesion [Desmophyllum pertusum]
MFTITSFRLLFLVLIITASYGHGELHTGFDGSTYVTYSYHGEPRTLPDEILLVFRTIKPSGILFHAASSGGDFITLELQRGKISKGDIRQLSLETVQWGVSDLSLSQVFYSTGLC